MNYEIDNIEINVDKQHDLDRDSVSSFRTVYWTLAPIVHSTKPGHAMNSIPKAPPKCGSFKPIDKIGTEDSASQVSKALFCPGTIPKQPTNHLANNRQF